MLTDQLKRLIESIDAPTPFYLFDLDRIARTAREMRDAWSSQFPSILVAYSYKTNNLAAVTQTLQREGIGAEVVSGDELQLAFEDGHHADNIVFDGPLKSHEELSVAVDSGVRIQIDSMAEVDDLLDISRSSPRTPIISLRLAGLVRKGVYSRFGMDPSEVTEAVTRLEATNIIPSGIHFNTGRHPANAKPYLDHLRVWASTIERLKSKHAAVDLAPFVVDIGGGFPAASSMASASVPHPFEFACAVGQELDRQRIPRESIRMILEPGRSLVEDSGYLVASVSASKNRGDRKIAVVDAGTNLVRSLGRWEHSLQFVRNGDEPVDVYGSMCFENDVFARELGGPSDLRRGDKLVVSAAGGYDIPSANVWLRPAPVIFGFDGSGISVVRPRGSGIR